MARVEFSEEARDDLREIWLFIAGDNPQAADQVISEVRKTSERLSSLPEMGNQRPDYHNLYMWVIPRFRNYLVFYRYQREKELVEIVRVLQGSQQLREKLGGEESL